jgi:hypothetical protein
MEPLLTPDERLQLVLPYPDYEPNPGDKGEPLPSEELIERMTADAAAAAAYGDAGKRAAAALVICVGNYEWVSGQRDDVIAAANALLDVYDEHPKETRRWG